ncbi:non-structural maintenance of chromosomes element 4 homolog A-like [Anneissia japonica]|uniref:non-structural maintenance of chromosomes element 4 homolog A-like n=1 Tax=Anneissia japonica TaxID=1529436 RepID=UPI00142563AC|nr:non-structural maintenance of chromosomes element 4 homolog A-like [Anneissia japonica]XP_033119464.1 non-structural maintenance of chromosomes element 4 homolog A-like [Anneissia japonica]XP_033119465.1 non-structural maintenance of chromosomes element 4 homolog A-like [Anneissia japonica]XP_033119466.1 non-structural maintenance of chromosomes element 4 homolog A-like [Anneissia japonica]
MSNEIEHQKRRQIRHQYRNLITETQKNSLELSNLENTGLNDALNRANELFEDVKEIKGTREAAMDSSFLVIASAIGKQRAQKLHTDLVKFDAREFIEKLVTYMSGRAMAPDTQSQNRRHITPEAWKELGKEARLHFKKAPAFHSLLGSFGHEKPKKNPRKNTQNKEKEIGPTAVPKQLSSVVQSHQEVTTEEVGRIMAILKQYTYYEDDSMDIEPVRLFDFVVNPDSFGQTIENIFYVSFLVKDGLAMIELDTDGLPVIRPCEPYKEGQSKETIHKKQFMFSLTMDKWKELIEVFDIGQPLIPTRKSTR